MNAVTILAGEALPDDLSLRSFVAEEGVSRPYAVEVEISTADVAFRAADCLQTPALLTLIDGNDRRRYFHGVIDEARFVATDGIEFHFVVRLRPAIAALAHREDCRIFQDETPVDVIKKVLEEAGVAEGAEWRLLHSYAPREFLVQYRESDLNFVERIMEDEGLFYFFEHGPEGHRLIVADDAGAFTRSSELVPVRFALTQQAPGEALDGFERERRLRCTEVHLRDFDFETPQVKPEVLIPAEGERPMPRYEYPGGFTREAEGQRRAYARMRSLRADADVCRGRSQQIGLLPGVPFEVDGAAEPCNNGTFVVTQLTTRGRQATEGEENTACDNAFEAIAAGAPFAVPRRAHRPRIRGLQSAIVTGPSSEQQAIFVDKYGRVKVRFHWDRSGKSDDSSSCWLRVAQLATGGSMILPRVGWELSVAFAEGNPDRPFATARMYNGKHAPPASLPGSATVGSLQSMSTPGAAKSNAIKADDAGGSQGLSVSAAKDLNVTVGGDKVETVAVNESQSVTTNMMDTVAANETVNVGANQELDCGDAYQVSIGADQSISVGGNETIGAASAFIESNGGDRSYSIGASRITINNGVRTLVTGDFTRNVGAVQVNMCLCAMNDGIKGGYDETVGAVKVEAIYGSSGEEVSGSKSLTSLAAEVHLVSELTMSADSVNRMVGGLHYRKVAGDFEVSASEIGIVGAVGHFIVGGTSIKLNAGPVKVSGPTVKLEGVTQIKKLGGTLKLG